MDAMVRIGFSFCEYGVCELRGTADGRQDHPHVRRVSGGTIFVNRNPRRRRDAKPFDDLPRTFDNGCGLWSASSVFIRVIEGLSGGHVERRTVMIDAT